MADQLDFNLKEVVQLAKHAKSSTTFRIYFDEPQVPALWWVKDEGTYIMSNGVPQPKTNVTYAEGFGPNDDYMTLREVCGGDDFAEVLPNSILEHLLTLEGKEGIFRIILDDRSFTIKILAKNVPIDCNR